MSVTCPRGHQSVSADYCDECGTRIGAPSVANAVRELCPTCATSRSGDDRFCEGCGHDFTATAWRATVTVDRDYFDRLAPPGVEFPGAGPPRAFPLAGEEVVVGRRSRSQGIAPDIDLGDPPEDPGVSHRHAALRRTEDGRWTGVDLGSTHGTAMNGAVDVIEVGSPVSVDHGDRIHIGAWTTIVIQRVAPGESST